eukprot:TRINITY_DN11302_c0_g1_i2.p1 TRINITY_DN11302_c0_g1~~TRINITY_DN11302_c0_g1_i2.p1  ORF type:complete len:342 (-),score=50.92 TRINITY_DN11302_c0_g1_i2:228-1253(-)
MGIFAAVVVIRLIVVNGQELDSDFAMEDLFLFPSPEANQNITCQTIYFVNQGDTLNLIAANFSITIEDVLQFNPDLSNPDQIFAGQSINIPPCNLANDKPPFTQYLVYYVKTGDTLGRISQQFEGQAINISSNQEDLGLASNKTHDLSNFSKQSFLECGKFEDTFEALMEAMESLGVFFKTDEEAAMFMAQIRHEGTTNPTTTREFCWVEDPPCDGAYDGPCPWNTSIPAGAGQHYYGRGPIQLTWVCNYNEVGAALGLDLVNNPDQIVQGDVVAWKTALWFWFFSWGKPTRAAKAFDFAATTKAINGPECGNFKKQRSRVQNYQQISTCMGLQISTKLYC